MSNSIENILFDKLTLDDLKKLFSGDNDSKREEFFTKLLLLVGKPSDSRIINVLNNLCDQYNHYYSDSDTPEKAKEYHACLYELFDWLVPFLDTYHKLILYTNLCILSDDDKDSRFHSEHFGICLEKATNFVKKYGNVGIREDIKNKNDEHKKVLCNALYYLGFLNLKEHRYEEANLCFQPCVDILIDAFIDSSMGRFQDRNAKELYFNCAVRMANCYEYQDKTWNALQYMLDLSTSQDEWIKHINDSADTINNTIWDYYRLLLSTEKDDHNWPTKDNTITRLVRDICYRLLFPSTMNRPLEVFDLDEPEKTLNATVKQYIHVLAHCLSEYAAKMRIGEISDLETYVFPACSTLQLVSRFLLDWLVVTCGEDSLVSCQATIRAENDACPEAISLLLQRHHTLLAKRESLELKLNEYNRRNKDEQLSEAEGRELESLYNEKEICERELTEVSFYLFYFSEQEIRDNYVDEKLTQIFETYGNMFKQSAENTAKTGDYDSLFHYYVIRVKYLLKRKAETLVLPNELTDYSDLDLAFANMCTFKEKCSDYIFAGLIEEYQRLVKLYAVFQKFRWLKSEKSQRDILDELERLLHIEKNGNGLEKCINMNGEINYEKLVQTVYKGIKKRKKILILAPVKDAPSCSSEYEEIKKMIEFPPSYSGNEFVECSVADSFETIADDHDSCEIQLKELNGQIDLSKLKFAIQIETVVAQPKQVVLGNNIYLYAKRKNEVNKEYRDIVPLVIDADSDESTKLKKALEHLKNVCLNGEYQKARKRGNACPRKKHDSNYGTECCTYYLPYAEMKPTLVKGIKDLLIFLEYDFYASLQFPICDNDIILISNPNKHDHHFFAILVFDKEIPELEMNKGLCYLCERFCVEQPQETGMEKELRLDIQVLKETQGARDVTGENLEDNKNEHFCKVFELNPMDVIESELLQLSLAKKMSPNTENTDKINELYQQISNNCRNKKCNITDPEKCYVMQSKKQVVHKH